MVSNAITVLRDKYMAGDVDAVVLDKVSRLAAEIQAKNTTGANAIQMVLDFLLSIALYSRIVKKIFQSRTWSLPNGLTTRIGLRD
jgi:hypothetical protein